MRAFYENELSACQTHVTAEKSVSDPLYPLLSASLFKDVQTYVNKFACARMRTSA